MCNLNCTYYFYYDLSNRRDNFSYGKLFIETLEILVEKTFEEVIKNIKLIKSYNIDFNILTVITEDLVPYTKVLYNYFKQMSFDYLQFSQCIDSSLIQGNLEEFSLNPQNHLSLW